MNSEDQRAWKLFFPYAAQKLQELKDRELRFAYYTTADTALRIFRSREIWMRDSRTLNDFREIDYGISLLREFYNGAQGLRLKTSLNKVFPGISYAFETRLNDWIPHIRNSTFMTCFSEHPHIEDTFGRLSMWRAYGRSTGVALVLKRDFFVSDAPALGIVSSPVAYLDGNSFALEAQRLTSNLETNVDILTTLGRDDVLSKLFDAFHFGMLCTKHPGFSEEREWRALLSPVYEETTKYQRKIELINGIPQTVIKVPLREWPDDGIVGLELPNLLDRVIIGPSQFPVTMAQALATEMKAAGIPDPATKITISDIPLRVA
jgi:hypothetical protein